MWDDHYERAFTKLKTDLSSPSLLISLEPSEKLFMYLAASEETFVAILVKKTPKGQLPIYYVSKVLHDSKLKYKRVEKLTYSLLMAFGT